MKLRSTRPFDTFNVSPVVDEAGTVVGDLRLSGQTSGWYGGGRRYIFSPNREGLARGLKFRHGSTVKEALQTDP